MEAGPGQLLLTSYPEGAQCFVAAARDTRELVLDFLSDHCREPRRPLPHEWTPPCIQTSGRRRFDFSGGHHANRCLNPS